MASGNQAASIPPDEGRFSGIMLFRWCQALARRYQKRFRGRRLLPSGARIFYYARLSLLKDGVRPAVDLTEEVLPAQVVEQFFCKAPAIAERLTTDFSLAVSLLADPLRVIHQMLADGALSAAPGLPPMLVEYLEHLPRKLQPLCPGGPFLRLPESPLLEKLSPAWILVAPIACPGDPAPIALRLLHMRLAQDSAQRSWAIPPPEIYLYDEPLACWLARLLESLGS